MIMKWLPYPTSVLSYNIVILIHKHFLGEFSLILGGGLFCHKNQSCLKLPDMDRSGVKKFSLILGGRDFSATKTKVAQNCLKWIDLVSKISPSSWGGGDFSATKTKVARNCLKWIDLVSKISLILGRGLFCHKNQSCSKLPEMDRSGVKKFSLILGGEAFLPQKPKLLEIA